MSRPRMGYQGIDLLGENEFKEIISSNDNRLGFFLGLVEGGGRRSLQVIELTKIFLSKIWGIRDVVTDTSNHVSGLVD